MTVSLVIPVLNEESVIEPLIESISKQTVKPYDVFFVDGGSKDSTIRRIKENSKKFRIKRINILQKKGNRAIARNVGIEKSKGEVVALTDAGCTLNKNWIKEISGPFKNPQVEVVAGYYKGKAKTVFQKCVIPYALVMPDKLNRDSFLPSTRSMAIRRKSLKKLGLFDVRYSHNEDYVFAKNLERKKIKIFFCDKAIVYWMPRKNLKEMIVLFFRFSFGDTQAKILRPKVVLILIRYIFFALLLFYFNKHLGIVFIIFFLYVMWSIAKNYKYVNEIGGLFILPLLQIVSDITILFGSLFGFFSSFLY